MSSLTEPSPEGPPFTGFSADEVAEITAAGRMQQHPAGEVLFRREEYGNSMFVIEEDRETSAPTDPGRR